jgi:NTE family protein
VTDREGDESERGPEPGTALCLSGGGYRAMLFHVGALWRLYEARLLPSLKRVSSVS